MSTQEYLELCSRKMNRMVHLRFFCSRCVLFELLLLNTDVDRNDPALWLSLFKEGVFAWQAWMCVCVGPCLKIFIPKIARTPCVYFKAFTTQIQDQCYNQESSITPCYHKICFAEFSLHFLLIVLHIFRIPIRIYFNQFGSHKTHYLLNLRFQEIVDNVNVFSSKFILHTIIKV